MGRRAYDALRDFVRATTLVLRPVVALGAALERLLQRVLPAATAKPKRSTSTEHFREVVAAEADVSSAEEELIHGVFSLGDTEVHEIMVPRVDIVGIDGDDAVVRGARPRAQLRARALSGLSTIRSTT